MADQDKINLYRTLFTKLIPVAFLTIGISYVLPFEQLDIFRVIPPVNLFFGLLSFIGGLILIIDTFGQLPDIGSHQIAYIGAILTLLIGVASFIYGLIILFGGYDVVGDQSLYKWIFVGVLTIATITFFTHSWFEIRHRKPFVKAIKKGI